MSSQPNRLRPTTTALAMLRRGWLLIAPNEKYAIQKWGDGIGVFDEGVLIVSFPLTADGFERMMNEVVNPPF